MSVTTLGAGAGGLGRAADQIVGYLEGDQATPSQQRSDSPSRGGSKGPDVSPIADGLAQPTASAGYYADSAEAPGRWRGDGEGPEAFELGEHVASEQFRRVLLGQHPHSGEQLVSAQGSAGHSGSVGSETPRTVPLQGDPHERLSSSQAAELAGVYHTYISRVAAKTAQLRTAQRGAVDVGELVPETPGTYLDAAKDAGGRWLIERGELNRFIAARREPQVVLGYDIIWSAPKSVSAIYAQGDARVRTEIDAAIESAVSGDELS